MKTLKIRFEYKSYPVWICDDEGFIEQVGLPAELEGNKGLYDQFASLQERFDATYLDTETDFRNIGFESKKAQTNFETDLNNAVSELKKECHKNYTVDFDPQNY